MVEEGAALPMNSAMEEEAGRLISSSQMPLQQAIRDHTTVENGQPSDLLGLLECILELDPSSIYKRDTDGDETPAHYAARQSALDTLNLFLKHDPDGKTVRHKNKSGNLPVYIAARQGHWPVIRHPAKAKLC